jgi:hypothetical protein
MHGVAHPQQAGLHGRHSEGVHHQGSCRNTANIDVRIAVSADNAAKSVGLIREFGFDLAELTANLFLHKGRIIRVGVEPSRIEILTEISACDFDDCYGRRVEAPVDGVADQIIGLADLIRNELRSGRWKDLDDAQKLSEFDSEGATAGKKTGVAGSTQGPFPAHRACEAHG